MREILFRGFYKADDEPDTAIVNGKKVNGKWVYGYYVHLDNRSGKVRDRIYT